MSHEFCRTLLAMAREEAKQSRVQIPARITALRADARQFFIECDSQIHKDGRKGEYVSGDCAYEAKARFIHKLVDASTDRIMRLVDGAIESLEKDGL
jgi:hypothetical protein